MSGRGRPPKRVLSIMTGSDDSKESAESQADYWTRKPLDSLERLPESQEMVQRRKIRRMVKRDETAQSSSNSAVMPLRMAKDLVANRIEETLVLPAVMDGEFMEITLPIPGGEWALVYATQSIFDEQSQADIAQLNGHNYGWMSELYTKYRCRVMALSNDNMFAIQHGVQNVLSGLRFPICSDLTRNVVTSSFGLCRNSQITPSAVLLIDGFGRVRYIRILPSPDHRIKTEDDSEGPTQRIDLSEMMHLVDKLQKDSSVLFSFANA